MKWKLGRDAVHYSVLKVRPGRVDHGGSLWQVNSSKYDSYKCWTCAELCNAFTFIMENIYEHWRHSISHCSTQSGFIFILLWDKFYVQPSQIKTIWPFRQFNDTSRYLDDIFTIDKPEFEKHIPDIYPKELQLNKANASDKETSFLDLYIKDIGSDVHTSVYDKRDDFWFPIVNFPWFSGDIHRLLLYGVNISQVVRFPGVVLAFWISI